MPIEMSVPKEEVPASLRPLMGLDDDMFSSVSTPGPEMPGAYP